MKISKKNITSVLPLLAAIFIGCLQNSMTYAQYTSRLGKFQVDQIRGCAKSSPDAPFQIVITNLVAGECNSKTPCDVAVYDSSNKLIANCQEPTIGVNCFQTTYLTPGTYKLSVLYGSLSGANSIDDITITVDPDVKPEFEIYSCNDSKVSIKVTDKNYQQYIFDFGDGSPLVKLPSGNNVTAPPHSYTTSGEKIIKVRGKNNKSADNCSPNPQLFTPLLNLPRTEIKELNSIEPVGQKGISDFKEVLNLLSNYGATEDHVDFDISLARGLSYYTGCIFEVKINNVGIGSVSGGGRYDNLTSMFEDKEKLSGVGFSFGVDRLYDAMMEIQTKEGRNVFPAEALVASCVLVCHTNKENMLKGLAVLHQLRAAGIASEIYPDEAKAKKPLEKPLQYATKKSIPNAVVIDSAESLLIFKNVKTGEQEKLSLETIIKRLKYQSLNPIV